MTLYRWMPFGNPAVFHLDAPWHPTQLAKETRHYPACGEDVPKEVAVEPDGSYRCIGCLKKLMGC
jgi:hypothetical protein